MTLKLYKNHKLLKFLEINGNTVKATWEVINAESNVPLKNTIVLKENEKRVCDPMENITLLNEYFINSKNILGNQHKSSSSSQLKERTKPDKVMFIRLSTFYRD